MPKTPNMSFECRPEALDLCGRIEVFDLTERADIGSLEGALVLKVRPHASRFFRLDAAKRLERKIYEAETAYLSDYSELDDTPYGSERSCISQGRAYYKQDADAPCGAAVVNLGKRASNDLIWRDVRFAPSARRKLVFRCRERSDRLFDLQLNGRSAVRVNGPATIRQFVDVSL